MKRFLTPILFLAGCVAILAFASCKVIVARNSIVSEDQTVAGTNRVLDFHFRP